MTFVVEQNVHNVKTNHHPNIYSEDHPFESYYRTRRQIHMPDRMPYLSL